jgi:hypothetical protein
MPANRKKSHRKQTRSKPTAKKAAHKKQTKPQTKAARKKPAAKKVTSRRGAASKGQTPVSREQRRWDREAAISGRQSGDLQGLSRAEQADSESVDELVEEGNLFEAGAVAGVEEADSADEKEVHTREVSEDDVPEEYLDKD